MFAGIIPTMPTDWFADRFGTENKGKMVVQTQNLMSAMDGLKVCKFALSGKVSVDEMARWVSWVTGWEISPAELMETGERLFNLKRMYNTRLGLSRKDDTLPSRLLTSKRKTGGAAEFLPRLGEQLSDYYEARGWTEEGLPTAGTLERLGLGFTVVDLPGGRAR